MKCQVALILLSVAAIIAGAQSAPEGQGGAQKTQTRGFWTDPSTGLMWAGKDNGRDVNWHKAVRYCRNLSVAGYSDWRLATLPELQGIYDRNADAPGLAGKHDDVPTTWHVKGNLFLTGNEWSATQTVDDRGHPGGLAWYFDFGNGIQMQEDASLFSGHYADSFMRALCVRGSEK